MKFANYLEQIAGVGIYPVISLVLFVSFFVLVNIWIFSISKQEIKHLENLPLDDK
jgi:cytochrome c oxidase cbb3-type subunit III